MKLQKESNQTPYQRPLRNHLSQPLPHPRHLPIPATSHNQLHPLPQSLLQPSPPPLPTAPHRRSPPQPLLHLPPSAARSFSKKYLRTSEHNQNSLRDTGKLYRSTCESEPNIVQVMEKWHSKVGGKYDIRFRHNMKNQLWQLRIGTMEDIHKDQTCWKQVQQYHSIKWNK